MRAAGIGLLIVVFGTGLLVGTVVTARSVEQPKADTVCGPSAKSQVRTTLYFGLARPKGSVSELEWQMFLRDEVTKRFPGGLTVWEAEGQWRMGDGGIGHERSKVLLLVHADNADARASVQNLIAGYRKAFDQESVLWETARVCAAF
jgi:Protein of unknown function (DUF3574)